MSQYEDTDSQKHIQPKQPSQLSHQNTQRDINQALLQENKLSKPFFQRAFGKMQPGSMRGAMFALMACSMGTGVFNLPLRTDQVGIVAYILYVIVAMVFSFLGSYLITIIKVFERVHSYSQMVNKPFGNIMAKISQIYMILYPWVISIFFQVIFAKFVLQLLYDVVGWHGLYDNRQQQTYSVTGHIVRICLNIFGVVGNIYFILKKQFGILEKISIIGVAAIIFNSLVVVITSTTGFTKNVGDQKTTYHGIFALPSNLPIDWFVLHQFSDISLHFQALASIIFCFVNQQLLFTIFNTLIRPTKRRLYRIYARVHIIQCVTYIFIGVTGYLLLAQHKSKYPIQEMVLSSIDSTLIKIGKVFMCFALFFGIPINLFPSKQVFYETFNIEKTKKNQIIVSLGLAITSCIIAIFFQKANSYFGLLGGIIGVTICSGFPALCLIKTKKLRLKQIIMVAFCLIIVLCGYVGAVLSVADPR